MDFLEEPLDAIIPPIEVDPLRNAQSKNYIIFVMLQCAFVRNEVALGLGEVG